MQFPARVHPWGDTALIPKDEMQESGVIKRTGFWYYYRGKRNIT